MKYDMVYFCEEIKKRCFTPSQNKFVMVSDPDLRYRYVIFLVNNIFNYDIRLFMTVVLRT